MVTMAQRIQQLRGERGLSRPALAAALGFPKSAVEKFETGRLTPSKEQQDKLAGYFGVSAFYLRGESNDRTRQENWMDAGFPDDEPTPAPAPRRAPKPAAQPSSQDGTIFDSFLRSKPFQELVRSAVLDALRSPEGQALLAQAVQRELARRR